MQAARIMYNYSISSTVSVVSVSLALFYHYRLYYNETLGSYGNRHGVNIRVRPPQFGGTGSLETLDPNVSEAAYFDKFIEFFEGLGYQRNNDIVGAGYDWRLGPG